MSRVHAAAGWLTLAFVAACAKPEAVAPAAARTPAEVFEELLTADRGFARAAADTDAVTGLSAIFAHDVAMPVPGQGFVHGRDAAVTALRANPDNAGGRLTWTPVSGGLSADGQHGFTWGYMSLRKADSSLVPLKYLAYWVNGSQGWRVAALRRGRAGPGAPPTDAASPSLPVALSTPITDTTVIAGYRERLGATEREFSDSAQKIGLRLAFAMFGRADAVNMGGPRPDFVLGADSISVAVSANEPSTGSSVSWGPDEVIVASSGDLGVTIGMIRLNKPTAGQPNGFPFFTIWRRGSTSEPWRYVAE
jgi:hypothetical protein